MALKKKVAEKLIRELHNSNKNYFVKTFNLTEEESEFLLHAWKTYINTHPELLKRTPLGSLDSFIGGYLAHAEFTRKTNGFSPVSNVLSHTALGHKQETQRSR